MQISHKVNNNAKRNMLHFCAQHGQHEQKFQDLLTLLFKDSKFLVCHWFYSLTALNNGIKFNFRISAQKLKNRFMILCEIQRVLGLHLHTLTHLGGKSKFTYQMNWAVYINISCLSKCFFTIRQKCGPWVYEALIYTIHEMTT